MTSIDPLCHCQERSDEAVSHRRVAELARCATHDDPDRTSLAEKNADPLEDCEIPGIIAEIERISIWTRLQEVEK
ncbi:MAG: hypothetical protein A2Y76_04745 [Planctomycetes bacterium RBG_13_60_9]|nr:MAG: hypothetical protein A2Y76_04745 [Planctomycetes bacterium RBG_13_60_9]